MLPFNVEFIQKKRNTRRKINNMDTPMYKCVPTSKLFLGILCGSFFYGNFSRWWALVFPQ